MTKKKSKPVRIKSSVKAGPFKSSRKPEPSGSL